MDKFPQAVRTLNAVQTKYYKVQTTFNLKPKSRVIKKPEKIVKKNHKYWSNRWNM